MRVDADAMLHHRKSRATYVICSATRSWLEKHTRVVRASRRRVKFRKEKEKEKNRASPRQGKVRMRRRRRCFSCFSEFRSGRVKAFTSSRTFVFGTTHHALSLPGGNLRICVITDSAVTRETIQQKYDNVYYTLGTSCTLSISNKKNLLIIFFYFRIFSSKMSRSVI